MKLLSALFALVSAFASPAATAAFPAPPTTLDDAAWSALQQAAAKAASPQERFRNGRGGREFGYSVALAGNSALVGVTSDRLDTTRGSAFVFVRNGSEWTLQAKLAPHDGEVWDSFGAAVAMHGDSALIGAPRRNLAGAPGAAYVFVRSGDDWSLQAKLTASDGQEYAEFGSSVALATDTAVVGAPSDSGRGAAYVFVRGGVTWQQQAKLTAAAGQGGARFGWSVALSGATALVGAPFGNGEKGSAHVFVRAASAWVPQAELKALDGAPGEQLGAAVALSGDTALVGAGVPNLGGVPGAARVFVRASELWYLEAKLEPADRQQFDYFGSAVGLSGDTAAVGAYLNDWGEGGDNRGAVYVFKRTPAGWSQHAKVTASDWVPGDFFGFSVALEGETLLGGAIRADAGGGEGAVYAFDQNGESWIEEGKLVQPLSDQIGFSVSISGDTALVGACLDDVTSIDEGSAHVFVRSATFWEWQATLIADRGEAGDRFGCAVSLSGDTAVVGAPDDDAEQTDEGAAYVFVRNGTSWSQQAKLTAPTDIGGHGFGSAVAVDGQTAVVGASGTGAATYIYERDGAWSLRGTFGSLVRAAVAVSGGTALVGVSSNLGGGVVVAVRNGQTWEQQSVIGSPEPLFSVYFGSSVALSGSTAVLVGTRQTALVFVRNGSGVWNLQARLGAGAGALVRSVAVSGDTLLVGTPIDSELGFAGAAHLFVRNRTQWLRQPKITAGAGPDGAFFGYSVSVSGDSALIGAPLDKIAVVDQGSAYVFAGISLFADGIETRPTE